MKSSSFTWTEGAALKSVVFCVFRIIDSLVFCINKGALLKAVCTEKFGQGSLAEHAACSIAVQ